MKTSLYSAIAVVLLLFGCAKPETETNRIAPNATDTSTTTSANASDTSATTTLAVNSTSTSGGTATNLSASDKEFIMKAALGGLAEVAGGQTAAGTASSADVRNFGSRMVQDHSKANEELKQLATLKGVSLPTQLDAGHKKILDEIAKKTDTAFDKAYMADMVKDHEEDVAEFQKQSTSAQDPDLKIWVTKTLPTLQEHLKMAKAISAKLK